MVQFVSTFHNRVDAKGRVSVPASFRAALSEEGFGGVYLYPALDAQALDGGGQRLMKEIGGLLEDLPAFSDERDHLATALFGASEVVKLDGEGRMVLPEVMRAHAGITDQVVFVGLGHKFQLWEPLLFAARLEEAKNRVRDMRKLLGQAGHRQNQMSGDKRNESRE